tara:strand:+ start:1700 stop:2512 length:813 start_codon:yes stop_codon:yes gene_type:complete
MINSLIFYDNPISRFYLNLFIDKNYNLNQIFILNKRSIFPKNLILKTQFYKNNFWALKFIKNKEIIYLNRQIEEFFSFPNNFIKKSYNFNNLYHYNEILNYANSDNVNSKQIYYIIKQSPKENILISSQHILRNTILSLPNEFIHIHPGYLPFIKGADGSLWGPYIRKKIGASCFFLTENIDKGKIISRVELEMPKFKLEFINDYSIKDKYRIWFSFFDPILRCYLLRQVLDKKIPEKENLLDQEIINNSYYSFMDDEKKKKVFDEIFSS